MADVLDIALGYLAAGLSVIPVKADGSKSPAESGWRTYSQRQPTRDECSNWFGNGHTYGIGIPGGPASGNLAVLDFETRDSFDRWFRLLTEASREIARRCPLAETPGGGMHLYVRVVEPVPGMVLARQFVDGKPKTLIEVRGDGHQVVAPGSPPQCHPKNKPYEWIRRAWVDGGRCEPVTLFEWHDWLEAAANLTEYTPPPTDLPKADTRSRTPRIGTAPGDDFNQRGTWEETGLFDVGGWKWSRCLGDDRGFVTRPGKDTGVSGSVGTVNAKDGGHPLFYCFTSNGAPFEHQKSYSRFRVYAFLKHGGDFAAAARRLGQDGYGDQTLSSALHKMFTTEHNGTNTPQTPSKPVDASGNPLPLVYYVDITPALDAADFVEGLLIDGAMSVIYGESGCGKTFFALDLALHIASGTPWRGRAVDQRGVLYLALEGSHGIRNRIAAYKTEANVADLPLAVVPVALDLLDPKGDTLRVIEAAKAAAAKLGIPVGLIVVDTLSRAMAGGNENASEDMGALVRHLDLIRQALPSHVAVVHHCGKDTARGARGHSLLRAATDTEIEISRDFTSKVSLARVTKQRELELGDEFAFRLSPVTLGMNRRGKMVSSCVVCDADPVTVEAKEERAVSKQREKEEAKQQATRAQDELDEANVLSAVDQVCSSGVAAATLKAIREYAKLGEPRAKEVVAWLVRDGELVRVGPFEKIVGNGAKLTVKEGYVRPSKGLIDDEANVTPV